MNDFSQRLDKNRVMIESIIDSYILADQTQKLLRPLIDDEILLKLWQGTYAADGVKVLRYSLYSHILSEIRAIIFDPDCKVASVSNVMKSLDDEYFVKQLRAWFCDTSKHNVQSFDDSLSDISIEYFRTLEKERREIAFEKLFIGVKESYTNLTDSTIHKRINAARCKMISHKQVTSSGGAGRRVYSSEDFSLKYSDPEEIISLTKEILQSLYSLFTIGYFDIKSGLHHNSMVAELFWSKCLTKS